MECAVFASILARFDYNRPAFRASSEQETVTDPMVVAAVRKSPAAQDVLPNLAIDETDLTWRVVGTLNAFRLLLGLVLLALFFAGDDPRVFGDRFPALFPATAAGYLVFAVISSLAIRNRSEIMRSYTVSRTEAT